MGQMLNPTIIIQIDDQMLQGVIRKLSALPGEFNVMLSEVINEEGRYLTDTITRTVAEQNGLTIAMAESFITTKPATPNDRVFELRVSLGSVEAEKNDKPLPQRGFPGREVRDMPDETKLVNLVTSQDDKVCPICEEISREGPYSMEEFNRLRDVHPHLLNRALHCRCSLVPFKPQHPTRGYVGADQAHIDIETAKQDMIEKIRARTRQMIRDRR